MAETETQEVVVDFGKICRLCLTEDGVLISLYSTDPIVENRIKSIPEKILELMAIKVAKDDGFPSWICHNCLSQVDKCCEFFDMCRSSQFTLNESYVRALSEAGVSVSSLKNYTNRKNSDSIPNVTGKQKQESVEVVIKSEEHSLFSNIKEEYDSSLEDVGSEKVNEPSVGNKSYFCRDCAKVYTNGNEFLVHRISIHHDDLVTETKKLNEAEGGGNAGVWSCNVCNSKFNSKSAISTHIRCKHVNEGKDPSSPASIGRLICCKYCGSSLLPKQVPRHLEMVHRLLKNFEFEHTDMESFDCKICYRPFMRQSSLRNHIEKFHSDNLEMIAEAENCDVVWNCSECDALFSEEVFLIQHCGNKHSKYPLEIDSLRVLKSKSLICHCGVITSNPVDAFIHDIFYHKEEDEDKCLLECPACYDIFPELMDLKKHLISFHWFIATNCDNECTFCFKEFASNESLRTHLHNEHDIQFGNVAGLEEERMGNCENGRSHSDGEVILEVVNDNICDGGGNGTDIEANSDATPPNVASLFACECCGDCYDNEEGLQNHSSECRGTHACDLCGKGYKSGLHLKRHVLEYHNTMLPIKCPLCPKVFPRKMNLHNHYKRRHLKQSKNFVCSYCGLSLKGKVALRSHEDRLHRNIRNYKCTECPEAFTTRSILRKHAQRHLAERPMLQCQYCERKFSTISGIERHVKTHEGVKDFICDLPKCGKSFYTKSELKRHIKFHTKDFRHVCPVCSHKFMSPGELKKHSTKHTGERPFKCHLCSCAYARRDDKVKHLKRVHNLKVKRVYGKPLRNYSDENNETVDTIVVEEECPSAVPPPDEIVYANITANIQ